ncbi:MAG: TIGR00375 family protein [Candidatus Diapherotrites archaeon]|uniref:TIGR00375 family protein n=1 Tax=Candidatus Iainarchaeum sp. TaxID=3101447 RepID=A0A2D6M1A7_9ARCH|nr:TIGR00375 family protein [Candidatus Diapherotrites archaeon]|tara:strand:- start:9672 stop:10943 length:1272 start_codon:yes stop_codon:yes gene_type:complete
MGEFNCDLHFHGPYSTGVSKNMLIPIIAEQSKLKGLHVCGMADMLQGTWFKHLKENIIEVSNGIFADKKELMNFIPQVEVQCNKRIHHLIFLPDFGSAETLKQSMDGSAIFDSWGCGRPVIRLSAEEIAEKVSNVGGIMGPAHAFTPYFSVYAHFDSVKEVYGAMGKEIKFMELGLSADTDFADMIPGNRDYQFITCSDSHSPWPYRIGREFTRIEMKEPGFKELKNALEKKDEKKIKLNVGLDPREGKYHLTACNACYANYSLEDAEKLNWRCTQCRGSIKRGVRDRIEMLSDGESKHPEFRPEYLYSVPLAEIIQIALKVEGINTKRVQGMWREFVDRFGTEINALIDAPIEELEKVDPTVAKKVNAFRKGWVHYLPGGGGNYGKPVICDSQEEFEKKVNEIDKQIREQQASNGQKTLREF